jgi:hypothetical protein
MSDLNVAFNTLIFQNCLISCFQNTVSSLSSRKVMCVCVCVCVCKQLEFCSLPPPFWLRRYILIEAIFCPLCLVTTPAPCLTLSPCLALHLIAAMLRSSRQNVFGCLCVCY